MRLLRAADHRRMAWKNGGGETIEIAVHPPEAGLDAFDWRVSMAAVASDGPFSVFPGIDRTLAVLSGNGIELDVEGGGRHRLTPRDEPLPFPADAATTARLLDGSITDLNVMTRRGASRHRVRRLAVAGRLEFGLPGRWSFVVATLRCRIEAPGFSAGAEAGDVLAADRPIPSVVLSCDEAMAAYAVDIDAAL